MNYTTNQNLNLELSCVIFDSLLLIEFDLFNSYLFDSSVACNIDMVASSIIFGRDSLQIAIFGR
jgi:hypothetical protein